MIHVLCFLVFRRIIVAPLQTIYFHLYGLGSGQVHELTLDTRVRELQMIVDGVNLMLRRMLQERNPRAANHCQEQITALRDLARAMDTTVPWQANELLDRVAGLERAVGAILHSPGMPAPGAGAQT